MNAHARVTEAPDAAVFFVLPKFSKADKARDLMRLISWGKSRLDPPPRCGATRPPARKLADPHRIRPENPPVDRGDGVALRVVANIDQDERTAKIAHLREHGNCSSWVWASTGAPGKLARIHPSLRIRQ